MNGPLLLAANHPNSFLDAVILDILFKKPIWSLARGDVFKKPFYIKLLTKLKILPVYRTSEGVENLETNYTTFDSCKEIFRNNGIVLMFSEGKCVNEWHLRPLKKGTARLAIGAWQDGIDLKVLPVGINYSSFLKFGKNVFINFGNLISVNDIDINDTDGKRNSAFNNKLQIGLQELVFEIRKDDELRKENLLTLKPTFATKILLFLPAVIGFLLHVPLYIPISSFTKRRTNGNDHHDSVLMALLIFLYPFYLLLLTVVLFFILMSSFSFLGILIFPFTAWCYVQLKNQLD